jgi:WD40 repeat protein
VVQTLAQAVHAVHAQGILHRDLKPGNVLVRGGRDLPLGQCTVKITDFGLAKRLDGGPGAAGHHVLTQSGAIVGTPSYMAPEQAVGKGRDIGPAADVYALGAILYELVTGRPPFRAATPLDTLMQVMAEEPVAPSKLQPRLPRDLETVCLKCLQKEPPKRYASAADLAEDLGRFLNDQPIRARSTSRTEQAWRWCRHNPALALASGLAVAGLLAMTGVSILFAISVNRNAQEVSQYADDLREALRVSEEHRRQGELRLAENYLERGRVLGEQGNGTLGMLLPAKALAIAPREAAALQQAIRTHLGFYAAQLHRPHTVLHQPGQVRAAGLSPDGTMLVTGAADKTARLWEAATGKPLGRPLRHQGEVRAVAFSPDGRRILTGSADGIGRLWDAATGRPVGAPLRHQGEIRAVAFSPDGRTVLTGSWDKTARLWHAATGRAMAGLLRHQGEVSVVAFSPDGLTALTGSWDRTARLWDAATGKAVGPPLQHQGLVRAAAFSPDGRFILTGADERTARLWERATGKPLGAPMLHDYWVDAVAFSPDARSCLTGSSAGTARLLEVPAGKPIGEPLKHQGGTGAVAISPDGTAVLTGSNDRTARLWDATTGKPIGLALQHRGEVWAVGFSPDGRLLLTWGPDDPVRLWRAAPTKPVSAALTVRES